MAPEAYGAERAPRRDFRMLGGSGGMETPPEGSPLAVWQQMANICGVLEFVWVRKLVETARKPRRFPPPALSLVGVRVILDVLSVPGQVEYPAPMNAGAS